MEKFDYKTQDQYNFYLLKKDGYSLEDITSYLITIMEISRRRKYSSFEIEDVVKRRILKTNEKGKKVVTEQYESQKHSGYMVGPEGFDESFDFRDLVWRVFDSRNECIYITESDEKILIDSSGIVGKFEPGSKKAPSEIELALYFLDWYAKISDERLGMWEVGLKAAKEFGEIIESGYAKEDYKKLDEGTVKKKLR